MQQLRVVNLQQHASDLASQLGVHGLDEREQSLTQHLLLFLGWSGSQHTGCQRLLALDVDSLRGTLQ